MRILMLTQWFQPEPFYKGVPFARELVGRGHEVEVLTGFPNYPGGKVYPGYRIRAFQREVIEGIPVTRVPLYPSHDRSSLGRIANYASFAFSSALAALLTMKKPDVVYVYHPPATIGLAAVTISFLRKVPFVYDVQDLWPDTLAATGMIRNKNVLSVIGWWCRAVYASAARVVVLSTGFKERLVQRGVPANKVEVIYNWADNDMESAREPDQELARELGAEGKFNVVFAGTMGKAQGLDAVLGAAELLAGKKYPIRFVFVGGGIDVERLKTEVEARHLMNVVFLPRLPLAEIGTVLDAADVLLVHLKDDPLFAITVPSKTQAYMAAGKPILMAVRGDAANLVSEAAAGIVCPPENPPEIADAVERLFLLPVGDRMILGRNGREYYEKYLSLSKGVDQFERIFFEVVADRK